MRDELDPMLRTAVEQVRATAPPPNSVDRSLERARQIGRRLRFQPQPRRRALLRLGALAASLLVITLVCVPTTKSSKQNERLHALLSVLDDTESMREDERNDLIARLKAVDNEGFQSVTKTRLRQEERLLLQSELDGRLHFLTDGAENRLFEADRKKLDGFLDFNRISDSRRPVSRTPVRRDKLSESDVEKRLKELQIHEPKPRTPSDATPSDAQKREVDALDDLKRHQGKEGEENKPRVWRPRAKAPDGARVNVGSGEYLDTVSLHISVLVEGPRARTVVDHVFRNPHDQALEGTFEYPLPAGSSPSYFAMFPGRTGKVVPPRFARKGNLPPLLGVAQDSARPEQLVSNVDVEDWGKVQEARVVARDKGLEAYEDTVRSQVDPGLLELASGNTFRGRVFPIPRKGYCRVVFSYEEMLPLSQGKAVYRFPLPRERLEETSLDLRASTIECKEATFYPREADKFEGRKTLQYSRTWRDEAPASEAVFAFTPARAEVQATSGPHGSDGHQYVVARLRPELPTENATAFARHAVFLLDASQSQRPGGFGVHVKLMQKILESDTDLGHFNIIVFNAGASWLEPNGWLENTAAGREKAMAKLDGLVLEGATDLSSALDLLARPPLPQKESVPLNVFLLSDGHLTWGETDVRTLVGRFEKECGHPTRFHCYRTGLGAENLELFEALVRRGGGVFNCLNEADLPAAARAHRQHCWQIKAVTFSGDPAASDVLIAGRQAAVYPGGELIVAARLDKPGKTTVQVEGSYQGKPLVRRFDIDATGNGELAGRAWGELAVAALLELNEPSLDELATAYCQEFNIASRAASFLILENPADYKRLKLEEERGKRVEGDLAAFVSGMWDRLGQAVSPRQALGRFLTRINPRTKALDGDTGKHVREVKELLDRIDETVCEMPPAPLSGPLARSSERSKKYLNDLASKSEAVDFYLDEARNKISQNDLDGAVRVLSGVIEEHPGRGDALRLVGYRLLDLKQPAHAARLFERVRQQRPFEPHSYRDLARALEECDKYGLAALQYEVVLAGTWHNRFGDALKTVVREEYARMLRDALAKQAVTGPTAELFGERLESLAKSQLEADLRVTITWNTDATDVDLWVIEPDGTKCFYSHPKTSQGELSQDQTQGYGPERYQAVKASPGEYRVVVNYFSQNRVLLGGETHVNVVVTRFAGTPRERVERHTITLKEGKQEVEVCRIKF